jgi:hypothetical protein
LPAHLEELKFNQASLPLHGAGKKSQIQPVALHGQPASFIFPRDYEGPRFLLPASLNRRVHYKKFLKFRFINAEVSKRKGLGRFYKPSKLRILYTAGESRFHPNQETL